MNAVARTKTVVTGLAGCVQRAGDVGRLTDLVAEVSEIRFHAFGVLSLYAALYCRASDEVRMMECINETYRGEVFNQTLVDQAMALSRYWDAHETSKAPALLKEAAQRYFSGDLADVRQTRAPSSLMATKVLEETRTNMRVAFKNLFELATPSHQRSALRQLYDLSAKEAKTLAIFLSTSQERLREAALEAHVKRFKRIALRKRDELDKALRVETRDEELISTLEREFSTLERDVEKRRAEGAASPELAYASLLEEHSIKPRARVKGFVGPLISLEHVLGIERAHLPATQSQEDQLLYRFNLLSRLEAAGHDKLFCLTPQPSFRRVFVSITKDVAANLVPFKKVGRKRKFDDYEDMNDLLPLIFQQGKLKRLVEQDSLCFGDSFRTDGIQLQLPVVNSANREGKARKAAARAATKLLKAEAAAKGEVYIKPKPTVQAPTAKLPKRKSEAKPQVTLPDGATLVALDTGIRNVAGVAREDDLNGAFAISTGEYYHATGMKRRQKELSNYLKDARVQQPDWAANHDEVSEVSVKSSDPNILLLALHTRGKHFRDMYSFYGEERVARQRFQNYIGAQKTLHAMVKRVAPKPTDVVVVGDADFGSTRKGLPAGVAGKFVRQIKLELGAERVVWADEFRSSCLDSITHTLMYHPPKEEAVSKSGKRYLRKVFGLYQRSAPGSTRLWNRDVNAARNIVLNFRHVYEHGVMPEPFRRGVVLDKPVSLEYKWRKHNNKFLRWREPPISADPAV